MADSTAVRVLTQELRNMKLEPIEGFCVNLLEDANIFDWDVAIYGPPNTLYEGAYFKAKMHFPPDYPFSPPSLRFVNKVFHPNVYEDGKLCISILHPAVDDSQSGELASERWNPTQNVRTILLSVVSLLNEPNISSPANVDASIMFRKWKESGGANKEYENIVKKQVEQSKEDAKKDNVKVPITVDEYVIKTKPETQVEDFNVYDDFCYEEDDDDSCEDSSSETNNDSGNEEDS